MTGCSHALLSRLPSGIYAVEVPSCSFTDWLLCSETTKKPCIVGGVVFGCSLERELLSGKLVPDAHYT